MMTTTDSEYSGVLQRDNYQCRSCGAGGMNTLHIHHIKYRSRGGDDTEDNLITLCFRCHKKLHDNPKRYLFKKIDGNMEIFIRRYGND